MTYEHLEFEHARKNGLLGDSALVEQADGTWTAQMKNPNGEFSLIFLPDVEPQQIRPGEACCDTEQEGFLDL